MTTTDPTPPRTPAETLRWAADRFGFGLENHPAKLTLLTWAKELDAAPAVYALPAEPPETVTEMWDFGGCRWDRVSVVGIATWRWAAPGRRLPGHWHPDHPEPLLRSWYGLLALGPLSTQPPAQEADQ